MENDKNQLIPINNSLAGFERQIAIGEKLLGLKLSDFEKEKIKEFLIEIVSDNYNVTNIISGYFPLTDELIQKFKYQLNWGWLCDNEYVVFTEELIDKYFNFIDWESISYNPHLNWNERLLSKYSDYLNFNTLFLEDHPNLKVTFNLYEKFKNKIDIENLEYFDFEFEFAKEFITEDIDIINWENLKSYTVENLELFEDKINWDDLSRVINIKNNYSLIEKFEKKWDWTLLTYNNSIQWTPELIEKYKNKIDWEVFSLNPSLQWSEDLIELYHDYWDWKILGMNIFLPWTADFYKKYENKFQLDFLFFYKEFSTYSNEFFKSNNMISWYFVNHHFHQNIPKVIFDENLIFYVKDILDWDYFSRFYEWSPIEIEKYKEYINWDKLSGNRNIIWSVELLKKYENKWDWGLEYGISWNKSVENFDLSLLTTYINYLKENNLFSYRYPSIKIRSLFMKYVNQNDIIEILEEHKKYHN